MSVSLTVIHWQYNHENLTVFHPTLCFILSLYDFDSKIYGEALMIVTFFTDEEFLSII